MRYRIRLVAEPGTNSLTGNYLEGAEQVVEVEADSLQQAGQRATLAMTMRLQGQLLRFYDDETGKEIVPDHQPRSFRRGTFSIDGLPGTYPGFTRGESWNGWAVPLFAKDVALRIAEDYGHAAKEQGGDMADARARYDEEADALLFYDPIYEDEVEYPATVIEVNGERVTAYPLGSCEWTWEEI